jgi:hypothetical protein
LRSFDVVPGSNSLAISKYVSTFLLAAACFVVLNLGLGLANISREYALDASQFEENWIATKCGKLGVWWLAKSYLEQKQAPSIVVFGSSQMGGLQAADAVCAGRPLDFVRDHRTLSLERELKQNHLPGLTCFMAALPGAMISDHFIISRAFFNDSLKPKVVVVGMSPRDFIDSTLPAAYATEPYALLDRFANLGGKEMLYRQDMLSQAEYALTVGMPLRRLCQSAEVPEFIGCASTYKPGDRIVKPDMGEFFVDNTREYLARYTEPKPQRLTQQFLFFNEFLQSMQKAHIGVLAACMPLMESNRRLLRPEFWNTFRAQASNQCRQYGAHWVDLSEDPTFGRADFVDTVHMNCHGGVKLARLLARELTSDPQLACLLQQKETSRMVAEAKSPL